MNLTIIPTPLSGKVDVISSKSLSHRYMIAAGLANGTSEIINVLKSSDLDATRNALSTFGVTFQDHFVTGRKFELLKSFVDCYESGSTLRFMIPIALLQNQKVIFKGRGRLPERPLDVYEDLFIKKGITYKRIGEKYLPLEIQGPLKPGYYDIKGNVSSQFISGLLFALPLLDGDSVIEITTPIESRGYIDLTLDVLKTFGIHILETPPFFHIKGNQNYLPQQLKVEGDFSQAAFWMVAGLIGSNMVLSNLSSVTKQGDSRIIDIIKDMQGTISYDSLREIYTVLPTQTMGITIDLSQIPDLGPILMVLASVSSGTTTFTNASRLRMKESDRLDAMYQTLVKFGVDVKLDGDQMCVKGQSILKGNQTFDSFNDHRIAMAIAIAAIRADGPVTISHAEVVSKSYPNFFEIYQSLGGKIHES